MAGGMLVALEGLDGSGTSTQAARLAAAFRAHGQTVVQTHQPSSRTLGVQIRSLLRAEGPAPDPHQLALMFAADRLDHVHHVIQPAVERGELVVCDRYVMSSWVYQSLACEPEWVESINRYAPWPRATFVLELPAAEAIRRVHARTPAEQRDRFETEAVQREVERRYAAALARGLAGVYRIDAMASVEDVTAEILAICAQLGL